MSLTSPLGLIHHLRRPGLRLELVPWLNVLLVAWLLSLLGSRYVYAPGMTVGLEPGQIGALPTASGPLPGRATDAVLTVETYKKENNQVVSMFYYKDNIYDLATWQRHMQEPGEHLPRGATAVLLLKASGDLDIQTFLDICDTANKAGFTSVQIAAQPSAPAPAPPAMP